MVWTEGKLKLLVTIAKKGCIDPCATPTGAKRCLFLSGDFPTERGVSTKCYLFRHKQIPMAANAKREIKELIGEGI